MLSILVQSLGMECLQPFSRYWAWVLTFKSQVTSSVCRLICATVHYLAPMLTYSDLGGGGANGRKSSRICVSRRGDHWLGIQGWNFAKSLSHQTRTIGLRRKNLDDMFSRFDIIQRVMDRQTDAGTELPYQYHALHSRMNIRAYDKK